MPAYVLGESVLPSIRDWFLSPTGNGDIRPACHRFFGFLIRYSDRTSRSLNGASRPLEQAFELVGRIHAPRNRRQERPAEHASKAIDKCSTARRQRSGYHIVTSCGSAMSRCRHNAQTKCRNFSNKSAALCYEPSVRVFIRNRGVALLIPRSPAPRP